MELFIGALVGAVAVYFIFFRKKEEVSTVTVETVAATAEVVDTPAPVVAKKPTVKKATTRTAKPAAKPAVKKAPAKKKTPAKK